MGSVDSRSFAASKALTFSVIMPCYNSEAYVKHAIESIVNQTYPYWELIAVNDGSKDSTLSILMEYASKDDRIKIFSKENGGYISAVNLGLGKLSGDYFLLLGSDDRLDVKLFEELSLFAATESPDCIAFQTVTVENGIITGIDQSTGFSDAVTMLNTTFSQYIQAYPVHASILSGRDTSKCYKRKLLGDLRYWGKYGYDADGIFSMLLCHRAQSFAAIPVVGYYWTLRGDSLSGRKTFFAQECDRTEIWTSFYNSLLSLNSSEITSVEKSYIHYFFEITKNTWKNGKPFFSHYTLIRRAQKSIRDISHKVEFDLSLSAKNKLFYYFPIIWKLFYSLHILQE